MRTIRGRRWYAVLALAALIGLGAAAAALAHDCQPPPGQEVEEVCDEMQGWRWSGRGTKLWGGCAAAYITHHCAHQHGEEGK